MLVNLGVKMNDLEVYFPPCKCGHERREHVVYSTEQDGSRSSFLGWCTHDRAYYKGMCFCNSYERMTNLEYLEKEYEKKSNLSEK